MLSLIVVSLIVVALGELVVAAGSNSNAKVESSAMGDGVGLALGLVEGEKVGFDEGDHEGQAVAEGLPLGRALGDSEGDKLGLVLGHFVSAQHRAAYSSDDNLHFGGCGHSILIFLGSVSYCGWPGKVINPPSHGVADQHLRRSYPQPVPAGMPLLSS